jgi:hypothetical protein
MPDFDIERGLERLQQLIPPDDKQMQERFTTLADSAREIMHDQLLHGITAANSSGWQSVIYGLHVLGFEQHPPVTFNDLCRSDRDYTFSHDIGIERDDRGR